MDSQSERKRKREREEEAPKRIVEVITAPSKKPRVHPAERLERCYRLTVHSASMIEPTKHFLIREEDVKKNPNHARLVDKLCQFENTFPIDRHDIPGFSEYERVYLQLILYGYTFIHMNPVDFDNFKSFTDKMDYQITGMLKRPKGSISIRHGQASGFKIASDEARKRHMRLKSIPYICVGEAVVQHTIRRSLFSEE